MRLRSFLSGTKAGRIMSILVLALFVLLCGLHIAGMHHDSHTDSFALVSDAFVLLVMVGLLFLLASTRPGVQLSADFPSDVRGAPPPAYTSSDLSPLGAPLLC